MSMKARKRLNQVMRVRNSSSRVVRRMANAAKRSTAFPLVVNSSTYDRTPKTLEQATAELEAKISMPAGRRSSIALAELLMMLSGAGKAHAR